MVEKFIEHRQIRRLDVHFRERRSFRRLDHQLFHGRRHQRPSFVQEQTQGFVHGGFAFAGRQMQNLQIFP